MKELTSFTNKELLEIGESILREINPSLFNGEPTIHKAYQICNELIQEGYYVENKELACHRIYQYLKKRTRKNQVREFQEHFGIQLNDRLRSIFTLSFRTSIIDEEKMKDIASSVYSILARIKVIKSYGITQSILFEAIKSAYTPRYYENEWTITLSQYSKKITSVLTLSNDSENNELITKIFKCIELSQKDDVLEKNKIEKTTIDSTRKSSMYDRYNNHSQIINKMIKNSEIEFIKKILEDINRNEVTVRLETSLYKNDERHPLVANFIKATNAYNHIISMKEGNIKEILSELKITVRAIKETGNEIIKIHDDMIKERVDQLEDDLEMMG